ncbi:CREC-EF hand family protein [Flavobacterium pallidum]|uniref:EF-hand domain-containing protein n=1 Tax=Flavobacterium pallidum TaxID=2172098 RepID=A0A2S1SKZ2_9FLAO|nr:hypothetical protein [Flavobacterium pallidum]AWI27084.1 hypothetical protein HYN49_14885 [Flavobacterium pallidum]
MKFTPRYIALGLLFLAAACKENEPEKPKVTYTDNNKGKQAEVKSDSSQIKIADLPIQMEGTKYLIHPIGDYRIYEGRSKTAANSSAAERVSFSVSNYNLFEITGFLQNLKFQHIDSTTIRPLATKPVCIQTAAYLNTVAAKSRLQLMVYSLSDMDTNKDGRLDASDIKTLYISDISGTRFTKLSGDFQELIDWNVVESKNRLYFRTIEDTNKNGEFDKDDVVKYHFVDLMTKEWKPENYDPVN